MSKLSPIESTLDVGQTAETVSISASGTSESL